MHKRLAQEVSGVTFAKTRYYQRSLFSDKLEPIPIEVKQEPQDEELRVDEGISLIKTDSLSQLMVSGYGLKLSKKRERLLVKKENKVIYEFPFFRLSEVAICSRGISITSDLIIELCKRGIYINFLEGNGRPFALITSPLLTATVRSRRQQFEALGDKRGFILTKKIVGAKLANQRGLLLYFGKYMKKTDSAAFQEIEEIAGRLLALKKSILKLKGNSVEEKRSEFLGIEGVASKLYWEGVKRIVLKKVEFLGRIHRGATDVFNPMLNYGYGILYSVVWGAIATAGLEPFAGFLHVDRPGKPSLVLDLIEEFRQPIVDRTVISLINLGEVNVQKSGMLDKKTRDILGEKIINRLEHKETHNGRKYQLRSIIQMQARRIAAFLRGEREYKPFRFRW